MALTQRDYLQLQRPKTKSSKRTRLLNVLYAVAASVMIYLVIWIFVYLMMWVFFIVGSIDGEGGKIYNLIEYLIASGYWIIPALWILLSLWAGYMIFRHNGGSGVFRCPNCKKPLDGDRNCNTCGYSNSEHEWALFKQDIHEQDVRETRHRER